MTASKIQWTNRSDWNPIRGCTRVSPGCGGPGDHGGCYAEAMAGRFSDPGQWGHTFAKRTPKGGRWTGKVELIPERLTLPLRWKKPRPGQNRVFVSSTSDIFHESLSDADIDQIFAVMALAPDWTFQVLTKRSDRMREYMNDPHAPWRIYDLVCDMAENGEADVVLIAPGLNAADAPDGTHVHLGFWPLPNVWLGVSVEDQARADERVPDLLATPAAVRWLSCEPLLGPVNLNAIKMVDYTTEGGGSVQGWESALNGKRFDEWADGDSEGWPKLDWIVCGGESGPRARPMHPDWARSLRDQCQAAGVPFYFKQWGEWIGLGVREARPDDATGFWPTDAVSCIRLAPDGTRSDTGFPLQRVGRARAGNQIDGRTWEEFPA